MGQNDKRIVFLYCRFYWEAECAVNALGSDDVVMPRTDEWLDGEPIIVNFPDKVIHLSYYR